MADLSAANNSAARRVLGYLADGDFNSKLAEWLEKEKGLRIAPRLYTAYYVPL